jgi:hypothetical protein
VDALEDSVGRARERDRARWFRANDGTVRWYYGALTAVLLYTLIAQCLLTHHQGRSLVNTFSYFTIQSNVLVLVTSGVLCARPRSSGARWQVLRLAHDHVFHYVVPAASVIGFVFVGCGFAHLYGERRLEAAVERRTHDAGTQGDRS